MPELVIQFKVTVSIRKGEDIAGWVAVCQPFDVWTQGDTKKEALKNIKEAVNMFLVSCFERGTLAEVMKQCGVKPSVGAQPKGKKQKPSAETQSIDIPIPFDVSAPVGPMPCHV